MTVPVGFAQVFEQTRERLRDPIQHFRDLDLYLPSMTPDNVDALRLALAALLELGITHAFVHPLAHALAAMYAAERFGGVSDSKCCAMGIITGLEAAAVIEAGRIGCQRDLIEKVYSALWDKELARLKRRRRAGQ